MILPNKHLGSEKSLLWIAGEILELLDVSKPTSRAWEELRRSRRRRNLPDITFDWFVLALDLLYILEVVELDRGKLHRRITL